MTTSPSRNRTRNNTMFDFPSSGNTSNGSNFGPGGFNDNQSNQNSNSNSNPSDETSEGMFYFLASLVIPSIICFLFLFYNFIRFPQLRKKSSNILIICLLILNFTHVSSNHSFILSKSFFYSY